MDSSGYNPLGLVLGELKYSSKVKLLVKVWKYTIAYAAVLSFNNLFIILKKICYFHSNLLQ